MPSFDPIFRDIRRTMGWEPTASERFERWLLLRLRWFVPSASAAEAAIDRAVKAREQGPITPEGEAILRAVQERHR